MIPKSYIIQKFYQYAGYPRFNKVSNTYYGCCPIQEQMMEILMDKYQKQAIIDYIQTFDPNNELVKSIEPNQDYTSGRIDDWTIYDLRLKNFGL